MEIVGLVWKSKAFHKSKLNFSTRIYYILGFQGAFDFGQTKVLLREYISVLFKLYFI